MKRLSALGIIGGAALLTAVPISPQWSQKTVTLSLDSADARIGRPLTPLSVAGVHRRAYRRAYRGAVYGAAAAYDVGSYYGAYGTQATATALTAIQATAAVTATFRATAMALTVTAIRVTATAATTDLLIASHAGWRSIAPAGTEAGA
jgi:hypothetical protein